METEHYRTFSQDRSHEPRIAESDEANDAVSAQDALYAIGPTSDWDNATLPRIRSVSVERESLDAHGKDHGDKNGD